MSEIEFQELTVNEFHENLKTGDLTVEAVVQWYLDRIEQYDNGGSGLNAVVTVNNEAVSRAQELDQALTNEGLCGPLHGVPTLVKDQAMTDGLRTTFGSVAFSDYVPNENATIVDKLKSAGAVIIAKTNLPDFAAGFVGYSSANGQTRNPYALKRDSGGSSAGTGAGIAANLGLVGIGEDTGGSIRVPASFCNLFGIRPTTGVISRSGLSPLVTEQDTPGPMCRSVEDLARVLDVLVGYDPADPATAIHTSWSEDSFQDTLSEATLTDVRIGVLRDAFGDTDDSMPVTATVETALTQMEASGATLVDPVEINNLQTLINETSLYGLVAKRDLNTFFEGLAESPVDSFEEIYAQGAHHDALEQIDVIADAPDDPTADREYWRRLAQQDMLQEAIQTTIADYNLDAIAFPDVQVIPPIAEKYQTGVITRTDVPTNTFIASQSGCPAVSLPAGFTDSGLPVGVELLGAPFADRQLVSLAAAYEAYADPRERPEI